MGQAAREPAGCPPRRPKEPAPLAVTLGVRPEEFALGGLKVEQIVDVDRAFGGHLVTGELKPQEVSIGAQRSGPVYGGCRHFLRRSFFNPAMGFNSDAGNFGAHVREKSFSPFSYLD